MSLKTELAKRLLLSMITAARGTSPAMVLVVDPHTSRILSSCLRMYDLMENGVLVLQNLLLDRERLTEMPAIYFIEPTTACINRLITDFADGVTVAPPSNASPLTLAKKTPPRTQYQSAHLYFTSHVPAAGMALIKGSATLLKHVKSFVELNVDFTAVESRVFLLEQSNNAGTSSIQRLYFPSDHTSLSLALSDISKPLVSLCITLEEYPHVRYATQGKGGLCKALATFFDTDMKKTVSQLAKWEVSTVRERGTLLIVDRSMDPVAPLMHEYTFQAMVNDVMKVQGEIAFLPVAKTGANGLPKTETELAADNAASELVMSEEDALWAEYRHSHISVVMQNVTKQFKEFKGNNKMAALQKDDQSSVKDMMKAMKDMPEYKHMMRKYNKHMSLASECMGKFDARSLNAIGDLEQDMATSLRADGGSISSKDVKDRLVQMCQDPRVKVLDKLRLVMIFLISQGGLQDATRKELMRSVHSDLHDTLRNLDNLGVDLSNSSNSERKRKPTKERVEELKLRNKSIDLLLMRYLPIIHGVIENLVTGNLKEELFPYTSPPPPGTITSSSSSSSSAALSASPAVKKGVSARTKKPANDWKTGDQPVSSPTPAAASSSSSSSSAADIDTRPRFIVFVLGGITFSEMRSCYEIAEKMNANLYIGSTSTLTPVQYLKQLSNLDDATFKQAVQNSGVPNRGATVGGTSASAPAARAARGDYDTDSDDEQPLTLEMAKVRVR